MTSDAGGLSGDEGDLRAGGGTGDGEREVYIVRGSFCPLGSKLGLGTGEGVLLPTVGTGVVVGLWAGTREVGA